MVNPKSKFDQKWTEALDEIGDKLNVSIKVTLAK